MVSQQICVVFVVLLVLRYAKTSEFSVLAFKSKKAMKSSAKVPKAGGKFGAAILEQIELT